MSGSRTADDRPAARRSGAGRPWLAGFFLLVFLGVGLLGVVAVAIDWLQGLATYSWEETRCTIRTSEVVARPEYGDVLFEVAYSFPWAGLEDPGSSRRWAAAERTGSTYRHGYGGSDDEAAARVLASRYQPGDVVPCWVDPDDPERSALLRANLWRGLWIFAPLLFVAVGGGALWLLFRWKPGGGESRGASSAVAAGARGFKMAAVPVVLFGAFFLVGTGMLLPFFVWPALRVVEARSWREVPCEILESSVRTHAGEDGATYSVGVLYRYTVDGREYLSDRYRFLGGSSSGREAKAEAVERIPPGFRTTCFVNPQQPEEAVLERGFSGDYLFGLVPLLFALIGAGGLVLTVAFARSARRAAARPSWARPPRIETAREEGGSVSLEPSLGPVGKLLAATGVALLWNGIVAVFVWHLIEGWRAGSPDWFVALVLTPFVLIGLLLATGPPYWVLALANPRPRLRLSRSVLRPGESAQVEWSFRGLAGRIRRLTIRLEGGPPRSGSEARSRSDDSQASTTIDIVERRRDHGLEFGAASFTLPADARPTSLDGADPYAWKLKLRGEIAYWPDVAEEYEIQVREPR